MFKKHNTDNVNPINGLVTNVVTYIDEIEYHPK